MPLLLDTHVVVAIANGQPGDMPEDSAAQPCFASVASLWEIAIKHRLGKLDMSIPLNDLPDLLRRGGIEILPIGATHVLTEIEPAATRDPFDRLLLAVCAAEGMKLVTHDRALKDHPFAFG